MQNLSTDVIRESFLNFFSKRGHRRLPSFPLVPINDNSLLLINAGMAPMKPYFTGQQIPPSKRVATCQKCIRTNDIDEVGTDERHGSFFEMLGNFSFGDYFKKEIIPWAWEFITEEMEIPKDRLYISVYEEDDEAYGIWLNNVGVPAERIFKLGREDNFWEVGNGVGPCGPCSEIHFDRGVEFGCGKPDCAVGCDCDRFMEIWNLVFTQFNQTEDGRYEPLEQKNIDTGMGLERMAVVMQQAKGIFDIDTMKRIKSKVISLLPASANPSQIDVSLNIITDHLRSCAFMASDGVLPSNEGRGYVIRRLLRRAVRHGRLIGINGAFVTEIVQTVIEIYKSAYPSLEEKSQHILLALSSEESRFLETVGNGLSLLQKHIFELKEKSLPQLSGADAFKLYDTYGFPPELTLEILTGEGLSMDKDGFDAEMEAQRERARSARGKTDYMGAEKTVFHLLPAGLPTEFTGYSDETAEAEVLAIIAGGEVTGEASQGQSVTAVLSRTVLYAESGGQKGDAGTIRASASESAQGVSRNSSGSEADRRDLLMTVSDCKKVAGNNVAHIGIVNEGTLRVGDKVTLAYDKPRRAAAMRNHSATHLLQKALREVLGGHVEQAGSDVSETRLRFDFTHFAPLSPEEKEKVQTIVNEKIFENLAVKITETTIDDARKQGAMALFGEKYGDTVRLVNMGGWSMELCGGTHVSNTSQIGIFKLISETGVSAGVRRIEAVTGAEALRVYREAEERLLTAAAVGKSQPDKLAERIESLIAENRQLKKDAAKLAAGGSGADVVCGIMQKAETAGGFTLVSSTLEGMDTNSLRELADKLREKFSSGVLFLCSVNEGAVQFLASATDDAVKKGINCGKLVKDAAAVCGGNGGGRPNHAQAGGKDASKAREATDAAVKAVIEAFKN